MTRFAMPIPDGADPDDPPEPDMTVDPSDDNVLEITGIIAGVERSFLSDHGTIKITFASGGARDDLDIDVRNLVIGEGSADQPPEIRILVVLPDDWSATK